MAIDFTTDIIPFYATDVSNQAAYQSPGTYGIPASYVQSGSISSIAVNNSGSGYTTVVPTITITANAGASGQTATARMKLLSVAIQTAGSGYSVNDTITLGGGTFTTAAVLTVTSVGGSGEVTGVSITTPGVYSAIATSLTQGSTSGGGTLAAFNTATWGVTSIVLAGTGSGYTSATAAASGGTGSGVVLTPILSDTGGTITANEQALLTIIEVLRAYFAEIGSAQEARLVHTVLSKMLAELQQGGGATYSAANNATRAQVAAMQFYAKRIRNPNL